VPAVSFEEKMWSRIVASFSFDTAKSHFQPRMAMTAAMAFFSLALTMNLTGLHLSDLRPSAIQRSVADARASAARSFQSMRVVYQVESRVNELRDDSRDPGGPFGGSSSVAPKQQAPAAQPAPQSDKPQQKQQSAPHGSSELMLPGAPRLERVSGKKEERETAPDADAPLVQKGA